MAWLLTIDMDTDGHGREGFPDGWHVVAFRRQSTALKAKARIETLIKEINDVIRDLPVYERVKATEATPQWAELSSSFPKAFGDFTGYHRAVDFARTWKEFGVLLDVVPLEVR